MKLQHLLSAIKARVALTGAAPLNRAMNFIKRKTSNQEEKEVLENSSIFIVSFSFPV